ncbi:hypothetical protein RBH29_08625 [Herbivorax sp. ANBcel31]|uniref:hypothetical protein n=1 Tax=Herbivorax sp. ANBcel31 TaxID=3069754 RepID=UPI0027B38071|nr:hypothetical protein [Herbivorax sp. ANBcel31]MDQ2086490.1 hypothetical protein [Herbivorax sp. ANBcel31]
MPRKPVRSRRKHGRYKSPFNIMEILYLIGSSSLFEYPCPERELADLEIETLHEHGLSVEYYKKHTKDFKKAHEDARDKSLEYWYPPY